MRPSRSTRALADRLTPVVGGLLGGLFFIWIVGLRILKPTEFNWVMQLDWRVHFLGWHFFRREPWMWPPGSIAGYRHAPDGTALAFTDSIPLVAFLLKPFSGVLPPTFQYLGLWLLICFILQGVFGVLIARIWTSRLSLQLLSATLFVLMPTLLLRVGHPSLCAHFLLLWALWLYFRSESATVESARHQLAIGLIAGLMHPYIAVMVLTILGALALKGLLAVWREGVSRLRWQVIAGLSAAILATICGWWASGLFTVSGVDNFASEGLGTYSMNLLSPITPGGWSTLLPEIPTATRGQPYEGFQYLGAGVLLLLAIAIVVGLRYYSAISWRQVWPILFVAAALTAYALSPTLTLGRHVLFDALTSELNRFASFRATGRFFWPTAYLLLIAAIAVVSKRLPPRISFAVLLVACVVQLIDLREAHEFRRVAGRSESLHADRLTLRSAVWEIALPHYAHMVLFFPPQCGRPPVPFEWPAYIAGLHGLTINAGEVARFDLTRSETYCSDLERAIADGHIADDTIYLVNAELLDRFRSHVSSPVICSVVDRVPICVTERSFQAWRHKVPS